MSIDVSGVCIIIDICEYFMPSGYKTMLLTAGFSGPQTQ